MSSSWERYPGNNLCVYISGGASRRWCFLIGRITHEHRVHQFSDVCARLYICAYCIQRINECPAEPLDDNDKLVFNLVLFYSVRSRPIVASISRSYKRVSRWKRVNAHETSSQTIAQKALSSVPSRLQHAVPGDGATALSPTGEISFIRNKEIPRIDGVSKQQMGVSYCNAETTPKRKYDARDEKDKGNRSSRRKATGDSARALSRPLILAPSPWTLIPAMA
ncbi:hypothetical protein F5B21DRAFT_119433 [Xylaria acuta]|nr:hypothetical protein F5B21DRAFT_119433 [Xylaria acuta]